MLPGKQDWWTDERVESTVTAHYIYSHLRSEDADKLTLRVFSTFSDDTYLQWILLKAKRLFLTLVDTCIADQIFRLIDEAYDDDDLPLYEDAIPALRLSQARSVDVDQLFYRSQFRYLCRILDNSEHIRYAKSEIAPIQVTPIKSNNITGFSDKVTLSSKQPQILLRKTIRLDEDQDEIDLLSEIAALHSVKHPHLLGVFASYSQDYQLHVLLQPAASSSLHAFMQNQPKAFEDLPKLERRSRLFNWITCLANALAWLHSHKMSHGAIRPSRVLIDDDFQPLFGHFEGESVLGVPTAKSDLEAYQYAAPEFWKRELTYQGDAMNQNYGSGLGRTASLRAAHDAHGRSLSRGGPGSSESHDTGAPTYAFTPVSKGNASRLKLSTYNRRTSISAVPDRDMESRTSIRPNTTREEKRPFQSLTRRLDSMSMKSSNSSENDVRSGAGKSLYLIPANKKSAIVQTWKSSVQDIFAADIFAFSTIVMEILTIACGRTSSAFAKHRSAKNRQAGRGGGVADASFHANLPQVATWAEALHKEADKKIKKDGGAIFQAVGPILQVVIPCLDREPAKRMGSLTIAKRMHKHLTEFAGLSKTHCTLQLPEKQSREVRTRHEMSPTASNVRDNASLSAPRSVRSNPREYDEYDRSQPGPSQPQRYQRHEYADRPESPARSSTSSKILVLDHLDRAPSRQFTRAQMIPSQRSQGRLFIQESEAGSPPSLYSHEMSTKYTDSEPLTPVTAVSTERSFYSASPYSRPETRPPDRGLPPVPPMPEDAQHRAKGMLPATKSRKALSKQAMDVGQATDMLAQSINSRREPSGNYTHSKLSVRTAMPQRGFPQIAEDEDEQDAYYAYQARTNRNADFVHGHGIRMGSRGHHR